MHVDIVKRRAAGSGRPICTLVLTPSASLGEREAVLEAMGPIEDGDGNGYGPKCAARLYKTHSGDLVIAIEGK